MVNARYTVPMNNQTNETNSVNKIEPKRPRRGVYLLPNLLTTGGMLAGFYAIIAAFSGRPMEAAIAVFVAGIFDGVDGRVARLTNTQSDFGVQFDSLADMVSFGLAPALVMFSWSLSSLKMYGPTMGRIGWVAAFLYAVCAAFRLARFNTQVGSVDKSYFVGLASPAAAGFIMSYVWLMTDLGYKGQDVASTAIVLTVVAGLAMVSRFKYWSFKSMPANDRVPHLWALVAVGIIILVVADPPKVLFVMGALYVISGPIMSLWLRRRRESKPAI